ncbi:MAG: 4'-phosphopantetheinyl transferase superfamily protein [Dysgonamonadaceae bacterium]|jgi:phosphopantetheinyl transferase|nr:4'-phosphopantetheinyl transferase superfamily protein [Dysgonamonadaceae bacterium]
MEYRNRKDDFEYNDNVILWQDAINEKIMKNREIKSQVYTFYKNQCVVGIKAILQDSESLLNQLTYKDRYLPFLEKMTEHRRQEWLSVRILVKELTGEEKEILYQPSGKPYLADKSHYIGISHTKGYVAVCLNKEKETAIDIEKIAPRVKNIYSRFMSEEEEKALSKNQELVHLLLHWSAKESMFKILNETSVEFKSQLHIQAFEPLLYEWGSFQAYETRTGKQNLFTINYYVHEDYVLTYI